MTLSFGLAEDMLSGRLAFGEAHPQQLHYSAG
jgi:hypothetical protein